MIKFAGITTSELIDTMPVVTEALGILRHDRYRDRGGRPRLPEGTTEGATPKMVAKLHHWERWSHRKIAAFLGWIDADDDWDDPKIQRRIDMRVRRWIRRGEPYLQEEAGPDADWKMPPAHIRTAIAAKSRGRPKSFVELS